MYSWEIDKLLRDNNFTISEEDYKDILSPRECPQIINVKYDTYSDSFAVSTNDGYSWKFEVKK